METSFQVFSTPSLVFLQKWSTDHRTEAPRIPVKSTGEGRPPVHGWEYAFPSRQELQGGRNGACFFLSLAPSCLAQITLEFCRMSHAKCTPSFLFP